VFGPQLQRRPTYDFSNLFWNPAYLHARHRCKHVRFAIALDELHWKVEGQQTLDCFARHRTRNHVAPDHYLVYVRSTNILEHSLKCGKVPMNIIDCTDRHKIRGQRAGSERINAFGVGTLAKNFGAESIG